MSKDNIKKESNLQKPLAHNNFLYMAISGAMIVLGFLLMLGPGTTTGHFNEDIFSTRRIIIGPTIAFLGFVAMAIALIVKPRFKSDKESKQEK